MSKTTVLLRWSVVVAALVLGAVFSLNLSINDNALDLLPGEAVKGDLQNLQHLGLVDRLFITLTVDENQYPTSDNAQNALKKSAENLGDILHASNHFSQVMARLPKGYELSLFGNLQPYLSVLFDENDLAEIAGMTTNAGLQKTMNDSFALLNSPAGIGLKGQIQQDPLGLTRLIFAKLSHLRTEFSMRLEDGYFISRDGRSCLVLAESTLSLTDSEGAETIQQELDTAYGKSLQPGVTARVIGSLPHTLANARSIQRDLRILLPTATILLVILLGATFRNIRALIVLSVPFMAAPLAIGITSLIFGKISALALGFGIVLLGIAVDFSIHLYLALSREEGSHREVMGKVGKPIFFATLTTASVLAVLFLSEVASHRQMATLALVGVLLAVLFAWLVIPTIISEKKSAAAVAGPDNRILPEGHSFSPLKKVVLALWAVLLLCGVLSWPQLRYNGDLRVLDAPNPGVIADEVHFSSTWGEKGDQAFVISRGKNFTEVLNTNSRVYQFLQANNFETFQSLAPILPGPEVQQHNRLMWNQFWDSKRPQFDLNFLAAARNRGFSEHAFDPFFHWLDNDPGLLLPEKLLDGPLQAMLATLLRMIPQQADISEDERFLALTSVAINDDSLPQLLYLGEHDPSVTVIANSKWRGEVERLLRKDIIQLSLLAGAAVVLLVFFQFRKFDATVAVLAPVLSALAAMSVFCWLTDGELNMMHVIMGIMVIG
ncbi:MAG: MMPL family transporter, partial [Desulfobulbaceae bacterium]|nr:MMPL family transporter [Desulfobulbaceae bacterium]